ncbi:Gfo/Idh/MocA family oxidoreductase [Saccharopolyspora rosea]|uniref:Gfo/Idh/MocA family oxidoreductase n=1 Tax=Saccharopolyspora rosea TaxID=524884 RepID=UPI0021D875A5|nr:Gfo/Idh/MocA family oxidoreductase [Saccharopolyspora rosea]
MLRSLVVGLGRAGSGLHLRVLSKARAVAGELFHPGPVVACDPAPQARGNHPDVAVVDSARAAALLVDPPTTAVHVCTPPESRVTVLSELAELGFRRMIVEKPVATGAADLRAITALRYRYGLDLVVVAHWLEAELTHRLGALLRDGSLGDLRSIRVAQHKPRFARSLGTGGHPTAFDVEVPHSLGVVLRLAGGADVTGARWTHMRCGSTVLPRMGSAQLALRHRNGVVTEISSDLTSPVQERRVALEFSGGQAIGHYPISEHDDHAQLVVSQGERSERHVFRDDALTRFVVQAYRHFHGESGDHDTFDLHCEIVRLLADAKRHCAAGTAAPPIPERTWTHAR